MKEHFNGAMAELEHQLTNQSCAVEAAVLASATAVGDNNIQSAQQVLDGDDAIDRAEIRIEEECLKILALYQPVAGDLRRVITVLKINTEIERVGDLAVNIAERALDMARFNTAEIEKFDFSDMVKAACQMLKDALDAMVYRNVLRAMEVIAGDDAVDDTHRGNYSRVRAMILKHPEESEYYMDCLTVSRCLERIADAATNIAEDVIYLESGRIVRHEHDGKH